MPLAPTLQKHLDQNVTHFASSKESIRTLEYGAQDSVSIAMRSSGLNIRRFEAFTPTATITSSNSIEAREMMSMCPLVTGSNDPGHAARRTAAPSSGQEDGSCRAAAA